MTLQEVSQPAVRLVACGRWIRATWPRSVRVSATSPACVTVLAVVLTLAVAWPVVRSPSTTVFGVETVGRHHDPFTVMRQFGQGGLTGIYRQPLVDDVGAWLARFTGPVPAYNIIVLLSFPLAALAAYALTKYLTGSGRAAAVSALAFAFAPVHVAQGAYHPHIAQVQWIPAALLALLAAQDRPGVGRFALAALAFAGAALANFYNGLLLAAVAPVVALVYWSSQATAHNRPARARPVLTAIAIAGGLAAIGIVLSRALAPALFDLRGPYAFPAADGAQYSARWWAYVVPPADSVLARATPLARWWRAASGPGLLEQQLYLGWGLLGLAAAGVWAAVRPAADARTLRAVAPMTAAGAWAVWLSLDTPTVPFGPVSPATALHALAPMFRAYARFGIVAALAVSVLAGIGLDALMTASEAHGRRRLPRAAGLGLLLVAAIELAPLPWRARDVLPSNAHRFLADLPGPVQAVVCGRVTLADESVPWLTRGRVAFMTPPIDGCADPLLAEKLAALGYTHLLARGGQRVGDGGLVPDGLRLTRVFNDSRVYEVRAQPSLGVLAMTGFHDWEGVPGHRWRWLGEQGGWIVRNASGHAVRTRLVLQLESFHRPRALRVAVDGTTVGTPVVGTHAESVTVGPIAIPEGDHRLAFTAIEPAERPDDIVGNGDRRPLTVMLRSWTWLTP